MRKCAVVGNADHVAGIGGVGDLALRGEEELRRRQAIGLPVRASRAFMPR
jgi:hypothetical protein